MTERNTDAEARLRSLLPEGGFLWLRETDSTNRQLRSLAASGAEAGTALLADYQTAGRGRMGRSFASPAGKGLYLSVLLRPDMAALETLTPRAAVALRRVLREVCGLDAQIKWVNDLLCHGKKLCGILTEGAFRDGEAQFAVLGVGLNVSALPSDFPPELRETATSVLLETGAAPPMETLAAAVIRALRALPELGETDGAAFLAEYRAACVTPGQPVRLTDGTAGFAEDVEADYSLRVRTAEGEIRRVRSGEVERGS